MQAVRTYVCRSWNVPHRPCLVNVWGVGLYEYTHALPLSLLARPNWLHSTTIEPGENSGNVSTPRQRSAAAFQPSCAVVRLEGCRRVE